MCVADLLSFVKIHFILCYFNQSEIHFIQEATFPSMHVLSVYIVHVVLYCKHIYFNWMTR